MRRVKGFTLIELLVVISIIAILLGILVPTLRKAKEHTESVICKSNLNQLYILMEMYLSDEDNYYPYPWTYLYKQSKTGWCQWHDAVNTLDKNPGYAGPFYEYLDSMKIMKCQSLTRAAKRVGWHHDEENDEHDNIGTEVQYSYTLNGLLGNITTELGASFGVLKLTQIKNKTSEVFLFAEENPWLSQPQIINPDVPYDYGRVYSNFMLNDTGLQVGPFCDLVAVDCFASYHNAPGGDYSKGFSNVVFVDGHLDLASSEDSYKYAWPAQKPE
jgi:prepilin-type N-terminal cleavage/methylation domain-containing protein/prepilin-type processing-associated H-X9-DG protein